MKPRTIALVIGQLQLGGAERQLCQLAIRLDRARFRPVVFCLSEVTHPLADVLRSHDVPVEVLPRRGSCDIRRARQLGRLLRTHEASLAHSFLIAANAYTWIAAGRASCPYVASSRTCIPAKGMLATWVHRRAFQKAGAIIANARKVVEFTCETYGLDPGRFTVVPNGVALEDYGNLPTGLRGAFRKELGIPPDAIVIGTLGRLSPEKNLQDFLAMARRIPDRVDGRPVRCLLAGDGPARAGLERLAAESPSTGSVIFAGSRSRVVDVLKALDLFVSTSSTEGLPNAVMEAMAAGLPVVATDVGGTGEVLLDGMTGYLYPPGNVDRLVERVASLLADAPAREQLGTAGATRITEEFSVSLMVSRTTAVYERILE